MILISLAAPAVPACRGRYNTDKFDYGGIFTPGHQSTVTIVTVLKMATAEEMASDEPIFKPEYTML